MSVILDANERVTAGIPSLTPSKRTSRLTVERTRALTDSCLAESKAKAQAAVAPDGSHNANDLQAQLGRPLHSAEIIRRLKLLTSRLHFEKSNQNNRIMGIYIQDPTANLDDPKYRGWRHLFGFEAGISPEFSVRHVNDNGAFSGETRGWRTVLARLIKSRIITEAQATKAFGLPSRDSKNWQTTLS